MRCRFPIRALRCLVVALASSAVAVSSLAPAAPAAAAQSFAAAQSWGVAEEQAFVGRINQLRSSLGLATLAVDPELQSQARIWAQVMKDRGDIFHTGDLPAGISGEWQKLGENVGVGGSVESLFDAFVASPTHYDNLVDPSYRFVGVGVVWDGQRMFTTHRFMSLRPPPPAPTSPAPAPTMSSSAPTTTPPDELAAVDPPPPAPLPPAPAEPARIELVLAMLSGALE